MNLWDILILLVLAGCVAAALQILRGKKRTGKCSCGCGGCTKDCPARQAEKSETKR